MDATLEFIKNHWLAGATGILGWGVGFFTDIGKEHFNRKMRLREDHALEVQKEILTPIYEYLKEFYLPVCQMKLSPLEVGRETINRVADHITQDTYIRTEFRVSIKTPAKTGRTGLFQDEYWHETEGFRRFFGDALKIHYPELLQRWQTFNKAYNSMASRTQSRAEALIPRLQEAVALAPALAGGSEPSTWANYQHLAILVLHRQLGIGEEGLYVPGGNNSEVKTSRTQNTVLKCGPSGQAQKIIDAIDRLARDSAGVMEVKAPLGKLETDAKQLVEDFRFSLAKKPALKRCPFV